MRCFSPPRAVGGKYTDFSGPFETLGQTGFEGPLRPTPVPWIEGTVRFRKELHRGLLCQGTIVTRQRGYQIDKASVREKLPPRREPYWTTLGKGRALGFRKSESGIRTWMGRWTEPEAQIGQSRPKYLSEALGPVDDRMSHSQAVKAATTYCQSCDREWTARTTGALDPNIDTVEAVCRAYIENLRAEKGEHAAYDAEQKLKKAIYGCEFGRVRRRELAAIHVQRWRNGLVTKKRQRQSANRIYRAFVAAANWGRRCGYFETELAWTAVGQFPVSDGQRDGYLSDTQRTALLVACDTDKTLEELKQDRHLRYCTPDLGNLLRGYFYTGTRPGELAKVRVKAFNRREKTLTVISAKNKKGEARPRAFYLYEPAAFAFFEKMATDKRAQAYLITKADGASWMFESTGRPRYRDWARGIKAAIRRANRTLQESERISEDIVAYSLRHVVITDLLSEDGIEQVLVEKITGTSEAMIRKHYYKVVEEKLKKKLENRRSLGNTEIES